MNDGMLVGGELKFIDALTKKQIHHVKFDIKNVSDFKKLLSMIQLKD